MAISQAQAKAMDGDEAGVYARFGPTGATDQSENYCYSSLKVLYTNGSIN